MKIEIGKFKMIKDLFQDHKLKDCTVVVDAQNFFYDSYKNSRLPYMFGCECDRYAEFLKEYLSMFKKANVKCYFIFKGGNENMTNEIKKSFKSHLVIPPILMKETYKQVLEEMAFDYVICEYEAKNQCIALAQKLDCPVISYDKNFCYSTVPYIPSKSLKLKNNSISCEIFKLDRFFKRYRVTHEKFVIYVVLRNYISEWSLEKLYEHLKITESDTSILKWLSKITKTDAVNKIFCCFNSEEKEAFLSSEKMVAEFLRRQEPEGVPIEYLEKGEVIFGKSDPLWFEKGVACRYIALPYINLYHSNILWGSWAIEDHEADDAMTLSLDIVKYAYSLLTNFQKQSFNFHSENGDVQEITVSQRHSGDQSECMFQNGWHQLNRSDLFNHFLIAMFGNFHTDAINQLREDVKLLMISLAYFSRMKSVNTVNEAYCIILSYIMLGVVNEVGNGTVTTNTGEESTFDNLIDKANFIHECTAASASMKDYFKLSVEEMDNIFDRKLLHPLVEFQHCLEHINFLNRLCGSPFKPTIYRKTFNGTFAYKILYTLKKEEERSNDGITFLNDKLQSSPIILEYFIDLIALYKKMIIPMTV